MTKIKLGKPQVFKVDTEETKTPKDNINLEEVSEDRNQFVKFKGIGADDNVKMVWHLSRYYGRYDINTYSFNEQMEIKKMIAKDLGVHDFKKVKLNRLDVCFDYAETYEEMYKFNSCLLDLYRMEYKEQDSLDFVNRRNRKSTSMICQPRHLALYIYDKNHESKGLHPYNTRIEFRFKDIRVDEKAKIKDLVNLLDRLMVNFDMYEEILAEDLYQQYLESESLTFSEFVRNNKQYITTTGVCEKLYKMVGLKGTYKKWLNKYRQANEIEFISKSDMKTMIADMKRIIKAYMKG